MTIKKKLIVSSIIGGFVSAVLIGILFNFLILENLKEERINFFRTQHTLYIQKVDDFIHHNRALIDQYAFSEQFNSLLDRTLIIREFSYEPSLKLATEIKKTEKYIDEIYILDKKGKSILKKPLSLTGLDFEKKQLYIEKGKLFLSHFLLNKRGVLIFEINLNHLQDLLQKIMPKYIEYFIISKESGLLFSSDNFTLSKDIVYSNKIKEIDSSGYLYRYEILSNGYLAGTRVAKLQLFSEINTLFLIVTGLIILVTLISMLSSIKISSSISKPVNALINVLEKNKEGRYEKAQIEGPKEIKFFAKKYNEMIVRVSDFTRKLEEEVEERTKKIESQKEELKILSQTDTLTGIYNRNKLNEIVIDRQEYDTVYSIIMMDIDDFKVVNDTYGHNVGDIILKEFTEILKKSTRKSDFLGRWGGEEFIIICSDVEKEQALRIAEVIRKNVENFVFTQDLKITASFGVAQYIKGISYDELFALADSALYKAKDSGKNRVIVSS